MRRAHLSAVLGLGVGVLAVSLSGPVQAEHFTCSPEPTQMDIGYGQMLQCTLELAGDSDLFRFSGTAGEVVRVYASSSARPCLELVAPDNSQIQHCPNAFAAILDTVLTQTGTYTIIASSGFDSTGNYILSLDRLLPHSSNATPIADGQTLTGQLDAAGDMDLFFFIGNGGSRIIFDAASTARPCIELVAPDNSRVAHCPNAFAAQIDTVLSQTGTYTIIMRSGFDSVGGYTLTLQCITGDCPRTGAVLGESDFDGDGRRDVAVYRPTTGTWYIIRSSTGTAFSVVWGLPDDLPVPGDYDGDGKTDIAVYRRSTGTWFVLQSTTGTGVSLAWGVSTDVPVPADYDGDGRTDVAVYRPSTGVWYVIRSMGTAIAISWGQPGDLPVPADYDGDGKVDPTVFRGTTGTWYQFRSTTGAGFGVAWGTAGDIPLAGDYDGDGTADPTVFRGSSGTWHQLRSMTGTGFAAAWGMAGDIPVAGDYDGDGKADPTVFRPSMSIWYQLRSMTGTGVGVLWGAVGDQPQ